MAHEDPFIRFILEHAYDDTSKLLFASDRYRGIDVRKAAGVIEARRKAAVKLPEWFTYPEIRYPSPLALEQCSSQATALYKQRFVKEGSRIADITGGLGVDCYYMSRKAREAAYLERNPELCEAAKANFELLGARNIFVTNSDDHNSLNTFYDLIFADPARRSADKRRVYSVSDCEPDILTLKEELLQKSDALLVKLSPMADIKECLRLFDNISEIHIVASSGEVKEVLVLCRNGAKSGEDTPIICADITKNGINEFTFTIREEENASCMPADEVKKYLFQPSKAITKAGAFKLPSSRFGLEKLAPSTHLYTADFPLSGFPGKIYEVAQVLPFTGTTIGCLRHKYPCAEVVALNVPSDTAAIRKKLGIKEGNDVRIYATTVGRNKIFITCTPIK